MGRMKRMLKEHGSIEKIDCSLVKAYEFRCKNCRPQVDKFVMKQVAQRNGLMQTDPSKHNEPYQSKKEKDKTSHREHYALMRSGMMYGAGSFVDGHGAAGEYMAGKGGKGSYDYNMHKGGEKGDTYGGKGYGAKEYEDPHALAHAHSHEAAYPMKGGWNKGMGEKGGVDPYGRGVKGDPYDAYGGYGGGKKGGKGYKGKGKHGKDATPHHALVAGLQFGYGHTGMVPIPAAADRTATSRLLPAASVGAASGVSSAAANVVSNGCTNPKPPTPPRPSAEDIANNIVPNGYTSKAPAATPPAAPTSFALSGPPSAADVANNIVPNGYTSKTRPLGSPGSGHSAAGTGSSGSGPGAYAPHAHAAMLRPPPFGVQQPMPVHAHHLRPPVAGDGSILHSGGAASVSSQHFPRNMMAGVQRLAVPEPLRARPAGLQLDDDGNPVFDNSGSNTAHSKDSQHFPINGFHTLNTQRISIKKTKNNAEVLELTLYYGCYQ